MPMKELIKRAIRRVGFDIVRSGASDSYRLQLLLAYHKIDMILDVGANIGQYAKYVRRLGYSGMIVSFEPLSSAYEKLIQASRRDPLWLVAPRAALGNEDSEVKINIARNSYSSSVLDILDSHTQIAPGSEYVGWEVVPLKRLDTLAAPLIRSNTRNIFLKIDVQGFEMQVLEGAKQIMPRVRGAQLELSLVPLYKRQPLLKEMLDKMDTLGFDLYDVSSEFVDKNTGRLLQVNGTFFRRAVVGGL
jgi:FkbM family methyltransferase